MTLEPCYLDNCFCLCHALLLHQIPPKSRDNLYQSNPTHFSRLPGPSRLEMALSLDTPPFVLQTLLVIGKPPTRGSITAQVDEFDGLLPCAFPMKCAACPRARNLLHLGHIYLDTWESPGFRGSSIILCYDRDHLGICHHKRGRCDGLRHVVTTLVA